MGSMHSLASPPSTSNHLDRDRVSRGWRSLLCRESWDYLCTLTYRLPVLAPEKVERDIRAWVHAWALSEAVERGLVNVRHLELRDGYGRKLGDRRRVDGPGRRALSDRPPVWVAGIEPHRSGSLHAHVMLRAPAWCQPYHVRLGGPAWWQDDAIDRGRRNSRGWARLERPRSAEDVAGYVAKYLIKGGEVVIAEGFSAMGGLRSRGMAWDPISADCPVPSASEAPGVPAA